MMDDVWPWLVLTGAGALHGLNPLTGWLFVAGSGAPAGHRVPTWRALAPVAAGHLASMGVVAAAVVLGRSLDRTLLQAAAAGLLAVVAGLHWRARRAKRVCVPADHAGLALWSFIVATGHGAGLMLVPALIPLCATSTSGRRTAISGSLTVAFAAVGIHTMAMLAVSGAVASVIWQFWSSGIHWLLPIKRCCFPRRLLLRRCRGQRKLSATAPQEHPFGTPLD